MVAILSPKILPEIRMTVGEYLRADLPEGFRYELVEGVVEVSPIPAPSHDHPLDPLQEALYEYRRERPRAFAHMSQRAGVVIPRKSTVREPDLALYREWPEGNGSWELWRRIRPFWVAEIVSKARRKRDYEDKRREYWRAGIEEYWIVDVVERRVTLLHRGESSANDWNEHVFSESDHAASRALPGFTIPVARLVRRK